jgi:hypothetical protein
MVHEEAARTLSNPAEIEEEIRALCNTLIAAAGPGKHAPAWSAARSSTPPPIVDSVQFVSYTELKPRFQAAAGVGGCQARAESWRGANLDAAPRALTKRVIPRFGVPEQSSWGRRCPRPASAGLTKSVGESISLNRSQPSPPPKDTFFVRRAIQSKP